MIFVESTSCLLVQLTEYMYLNKGNKLENIFEWEFSNEIFISNKTNLLPGPLHLHTQKRHRPVTACCTIRPDTGMIS